MNLGVANDQNPYTEIIYHTAFIINFCKPKCLWIRISHIAVSTKGKVYMLGSMLQNDF
jgi:hypothetical protein